MWSEWFKGVRGVWRTRRKEAWQGPEIRECAKVGTEGRGPSCGAWVATQMQSDQAQPLIRSDSEAMLFLWIPGPALFTCLLRSICPSLQKSHSNSGLKSYLGKDTYQPDSPDIAEILICHTVRREGLWTIPAYNVLGEGMRGWHPSPWWTSQPGQQSFFCKLSIAFPLCLLPTAVPLKCQPRGASQTCLLLLSLSY